MRLGDPSDQCAPNCLLFYHATRFRAFGWYCRHALQCTEVSVGMNKNCLLLQWREQGHSRVDWIIKYCRISAAALYLGHNRQSHDSVGAAQWESEQWAVLELEEQKVPGGRISTRWPKTYLNFRDECQEKKVGGKKIGPSESDSTKRSGSDPIASVGVSQPAAIVACLLLPSAPNNSHPASPNLSYAAPVLLEGFHINSCTLWKMYPHTKANLQLWVWCTIGILAWSGFLP